MRYAVANNAKTVLTAALNATDDIMQVHSTERFPVSEYPYLVSINNEILEVQPASEDTFAILNRGCEGTTPAKHPIGSIVENRITAGTYEGLLEEIDKGGWSSDSVEYRDLTGQIGTIIDLTANDATYQYIIGSNFDVTFNLPSDAPPGKKFTFVLSSSNCFCAIKFDGNTLDGIGGYGIKSFIFDGTRWLNITLGMKSEAGITIGWMSQAETNAVAIGDSANAGFKGTSIGPYAYSDDFGMAIGDSASASVDGMAIGDSASASVDGIAIGGGASALSGGIAIGSDANGGSAGIAMGEWASCESAPYSFAKGYNSVATRYGEEVRCIDFFNSYSTVGWVGTNPANNNWTELFLGGVSNQRLLLKYHGATGFSIYLTCATFGYACRYKVEGVAFSNPSLCDVGDLKIDMLSEVSLEPINTPEVTVEASRIDNKNYLILKVRGDSQFRWVARGELEEVSL